MRSGPWLREVALDEWGQFVEFIHGMLRQSAASSGVDKMWFRGQGDAEWPLIASFDRIFGELASGLRATVYDSMIETFRERTALRNDVSTLGDEELICIMQHYGAPTRVLDWSASPYAAAYFAFASASALSRDEPESDCAVFILNADPEVFKGFHTVKLISSVPHGNPRALAQRGRFTLNLSSEADLLAELGNLSRASNEADQWLITKVTLPRGVTSVALRDLELMGISSETLFPELEGVAKYAFFRAMNIAGLLDA